MFVIVDLKISGALTLSIILPLLIKRKLISPIGVFSSLISKDFSMSYKLFLLIFSSDLSVLFTAPILAT